MKKTLLLLVVAISVSLMVSVMAVKPDGVGNPGNGRQDDSGNDSIDDSWNGNSGKSGEKGKSGIKEVLSNESCSSETGSERAQCRNERREELQESFRNCTSEANVSECVQERKRERWEARIETMEEACSQNDTSACRRAVNTFKECHDETPGLDRAACARDKLRLGKAVSQLLGECRNQTGNGTEAGNTVRVRACIQNVTESVYTYVALKIQDLADRAEGLIALGVNETAVNEFVAFAEESITAFGEASTLEEKKQIVLDVRHAWQGLIQEANASL